MIRVSLTEHQLELDFPLSNRMTLNRIERVNRVNIKAALVCHDNVAHQNQLLALLFNLVERIIFLRLIERV